ncbi:uncharacterized protein BDW47DRAFT_122660 [Aspergillus candidus]|uniref:Uncharacterized protein n=1 Tax=Aspergillus candidus TaxID=41067 RepID=A0A2I2FLX0_ASPCN|nr:hypothetical protein BDW47DRAFT_122660 [Aspergillus candidus]PLB41622.1 hypothetical protein BDW47DRAFT_122660 [Aspergillus candidus]
MCPMLANDFSDGPAMVLSPSQDHAFLNFSRASKRDIVPPAMLFGAAPPPPSKPSRKRSRDEAAFEEALHPNPPIIMPTPASQRQEPPIFGSSSGGTVSNTPSVASWSSDASADHLRGRKATRLGPTTPGLQDSTLASMPHPLADDPHAAAPEARNRSPQEPTVDDTTHLLGISWQRIQVDDSDIAAAVRGWKKYIDRQFATHLGECEILMKNRALNAYLVSARPAAPLGLGTTPAFYLFNDDLTQAQLVGSSWEAAVRHLSASPITFEGTQILGASDRPLADAPHDQNLLGANPAEPPLLQTMCAQPASLGTGMDLDA